MQHFIRQAARYIFTISLMATLMACGGGGSGAPPALNYSGVTTGVVIDEDNAKTLLTGAYEGGQTAAVFNIFGAVQVDPQHSANTPRMLALAGIFKAFLDEMDVAQPVQYAGALITDSETIQGSCGGEAYYDVDIDSIFGDFSGTADFREYCDASNPDLVLDGITDFSGDFDLFSQEIEDFAFIFRDLAAISDAGSYTLNGSLNGNVSTTRAYVKTTSVLTDNSTNKTYWLKDFEVTAEQGGGFVAITADGRYYDHDYGYVDVSTEQAFILYDNDDWPSSGIFVLTGGEGDAGGNTMARMVVLDADSFQVEADTDGDGSFDDYNSGLLLWTDM